MKGNKATHVAGNHVTLFSPEEHAAQLAVLLVQLKLERLCPDRLRSQLLTAEIFPSERLIDSDLTLIALLRLLHLSREKSQPVLSAVRRCAVLPRRPLFLFVCFLFCQILAEELLSQLPLAVHVDLSVLVHM